MTTNITLNPQAIVEGFSQLRAGHIPKGCRKRRPWTIETATRDLELLKGLYADDLEDLAWSHGAIMAVEQWLAEQPVSV